MELTKFQQEHPPIEMVVSSTRLRKSKKEQLGYDESKIIITHNQTPIFGFYGWFLLVVGGMLTLLSMLGLLGTWLKKD